MTESELVHSILRQAEGEGRRLHAERLARVRCRLSFQSQLDERLIQEMFARWRRDTLCEHADLEVEHLPPYALCPRHRQFLADCSGQHAPPDGCPYCSLEANEMAGREWTLIGIDAASDVVC
ncbi:hydrogenase nickel incorporation protein HypA [Phycisphaerae bacterium RAS1]|nr:hydrogenase nickel incorporation protein HypA [Phycisphaerae bacterium RAS1]